MGKLAGITRRAGAGLRACGVPANAAAYAFNVTVVPQGSLSYLTAWPTGQTQQFVSTLNSLDGTVIANAAIVPPGPAARRVTPAMEAGITDHIWEIGGSQVRLLPTGDA